MTLFSFDIIVCDMLLSFRGILAWPWIAPRRQLRKDGLDYSCGGVLLGCWLSRALQFDHNSSPSFIRSHVPHCGSPFLVCVIVSDCVQTYTAIYFHVCVQIYELKKSFSIDDLAFLKENPTHCAMATEFIGFVYCYNGQNYSVCRRVSIEIDDFPINSCLYRYYNSVHKTRA